MFPFFAAGAALSGIGAIGKAIFGIGQNHKANQIHPEWHQYETSPYAKQQLGLAQQLFNGRMAGAGNLENNIAASQANFTNSIDRNATDSAQALALASAGQATANQGYNDLQTKELQNKYGLLNNLNAGYDAMTAEGDKVYQSQLAKYQMDKAEQAGLRNAGWQNIFGGINDASSLMLQLDQKKKQQQFNSNLLNGLF